MAKLAREEKRKRYAEKKAKNAQRKAAQEIEAPPFPVDNVQDCQEGAVKFDSEERKSKESKKRKWGEASLEDRPAHEVLKPSSKHEADAVALEEREKGRKSKKRKKDFIQQEDAQEVGAGDAGDGQANGSDGKAQRFIVFVGNLPFSATKECVAAHFKAVHPESVRLITDKKTGKPKGFAFLEFEAYDRMKTCLKLYHHSSFTDGDTSRKINVELTAGGGGSKSEARKEKLRAKNEKLNEERKRRIQYEQKRKAREEKKEKRKKQDVGETSKMCDAPTDTAQEDYHQGIHPSRRARMNP